VKLDGERVRETRERLALSIEDACGQAHVSTHTWVKAERGGEIRPSSARRIAGALGVEPSQLMGDPLVPLVEALPSPKAPEEPKEAEERRTSRSYDPNRANEYRARFTQNTQNIRKCLEMYRRLMRRPDFDGDMAMTVMQAARGVYNIAERWLGLNDELDAVFAAAEEGQHVPEDLLRAATELRDVLGGRAGLQSVGAKVLEKIPPGSPLRRLSFVDTAETDSDSRRRYEAG
jgi:transcriptional regulator with XRE-family HTH domain